MVRTEGLIQVSLGTFTRTEGTAMMGDGGKVYIKPTGQRGYNMFMRIDLAKLDTELIQRALQSPHLQTILAQGAIKIFADRQSERYFPLSPKD